MTVNLFSVYAYQFINSEIGPTLKQISQFFSSLIPTSFKKNHILKRMPEEKYPYERDPKDPKDEIF